MSGHSHAKTVKATKDANAAVKGKIFSKMARLISLAAKEGGSPEFNAKLKSAIDTAKKFNMPKDNIERAIKKGTGELEGENLETIVVEILGPGGINIIVEGITDNKNRSFGEIKQIAQKRGCKLANEGSLRWQFDRQGIILADLKSQISNLKSKEKMELIAIEVGAKDTQWSAEDNEEILEIRTIPEELANIKMGLEEKGIEIESANLGWVAKEEVEASQSDKSIAEKLFEDLNESDSVQNIYSNLKS
ncbi:MAG: YebC/PmpR family DNA-binding transcriptional regulator [Candidatus Pacebacteria bacterium]|nr:YebC/PmpR family DNA-binding transcriptional regulator [Candidatus Paceibacterota bacterium]